MYKKLFTDFHSTTTNEWENLINKDLKGSDYNKRLITSTIEHVDIRPYYRKDNIIKSNIVDVIPNQFPFLRGNNNKPVVNKICQEILVDDFIVSNNKALSIIKNGITSITFILLTDTISEENIANLLKGIDLNCVQLVFTAKSYNNLTPILKDYSKSFSNSDILFNYDSIGFKTISGEFCNDNFIKDFKLLCSEGLQFNNLRFLNISAFNFRNAGSSVVQELAFALSSASEYISMVDDFGFSIDKFLKRITFSFGIGSNYFMEIAKLRAARFLWAKICKAYSIKDDKSAQMYVHSVTSDFNKTAYDPYVNVLRTTTEAMSALIGGTDSLLVKPLNHIYEDSTEFSERIAKNIQIILNEESYFDKFIDPSSGSYYIESLTQSIIEKTWELFLEVESQGGYLKALDNGFVKNEIERVANIRDNNIAFKKEVLLGINQYPKQGETVNIQLKTSKTNTKNAIRLYRGAEKFEQLRQKTEQQQNTPNVLLIKYGNLTMRKARATFASNFFACAGFNIIEPDFITSFDDAIKLYNKYKSEIVVLCSSDDEYTHFAKDLFNSIDNEGIFVIAGNPKEYIEDFNKNGIVNFIHVKSNILETLQNYQAKLFKS